MSKDKKNIEFWKDTDTWREEPDFWRKGIMKKLPVLLSLFFVMITGVLLTIFFKQLLPIIPHDLIIVLIMSGIFFLKLKNPFLEKFQQKRSLSSQI